MAALPQFMPEGNPGDAVKFGIAGENAQQSWMNQAQERRNRAQEAEQSAAAAQRSQQQFQTMLPALVAKAAADTASSQNTLAAVTAEQLARAKYSSLLATAPDDIFDGHDWENHPEWYEADGTPDWGKYTEAQEKLQAKYAPLGLIPEGKAYLDQINHNTARGYQMQTAHNTMQSMVDRAKAGADSREIIASQNNDTKQQIQQMKAEQQQTVNEMRKQIEDLKAQTTIKKTEITAGAAINRPANQAAVKANEAFLQAGEVANQELVQLNKGLELLDDPGLRTGTGAAFVLSAERLGRAVGLDVGQPQNMEQLQSVLGTQLLDRAKSIKGRLTNTEVGILDHMSPSLAKTPEGNHALLTMLKAAREREFGVAKIVNEGRKQGLSEREIQLEANDFMLSQGAPKAPAPAAAQPWTPDKEARLKELMDKKSQNAPAVP